MVADCDWCWGSHGCDLPAGHPVSRETPHICDSQIVEGRCSEHDGTHCRFWMSDGSLSDWKPYPGFTI